MFDTNDMFKQFLTLKWHSLETLLTSLLPKKLVNTELNHNLWSSCSVSWITLNGILLKIFRFLLQLAAGCNSYEYINFCHCRRSSTRVIREKIAALFKIANCAAVPTVYCRSYHIHRYDLSILKTFFGAVTNSLIRVCFMNESMTFNNTVQFKIT